MITEKEIYKLAYLKQAERWHRALKRKEELPDNRYTKFIEKEEYEKLREITNKLYELEQE